MKEVEDLRTPSGKIAFVLQCGYFRSSNRFFGNQFYSPDISFVANHLALPMPISLEIPKQTLSRHRQIISEFFGFRRLIKADKEQLASEIADLGKR
jgi:Domain of unknown function (DUF4158)